MFIITKSIKNNNINNIYQIKTKQKKQSNTFRKKRNLKSLKDNFSVKIFV